VVVGLYAWRQSRRMGVLSPLGAAFVGNLAVALFGDPVANWGLTALYSDTFHLLPRWMGEPHGSAGTRRTGRDERHVGRAGEARVLGPVDEAGQVAVVMVGPPDDLVGQPRMGGEGGDDRPRHVEDDVIPGSRQPDHDVVLGRRHDLAGRAGDRLVEAASTGRRCIGRARSP